MKNKHEIAPEINVHHLWYHKSAYRHRHEKHLRNHHAFQVTADVPSHNYLHHTLYKGPPKPPKQECIDLVDFVEADVHPSMKVDRFWGAEAAMRFFVIMEGENEAEGERYRDTRLHLAQQIGILSRKSAGIDYPTTEEMRHYGT